MTTPSIKGIAFSSIVADVVRLVEEGRIDKDELAVRLEAEDLRFMDEKVQPGKWYPTASYARFGAVLDRIEGRGRPAYFIERGARAAERLFAAGVYSQLERADRRAAEIEGESSLTRLDIRVTLSLWNAMFNFTTWEYQPDPNDLNTFTCEVSGATGFPEVLRLAAQGFLEYGFSRLAGSPVAVASERTGEDQIVYSFDLNAEPG
jgi:hypothetical protein